ncbi:preprotein translocase subunit YajC [Corynebacterium propinquum]|uniref:preprotein translocase subunit YajC n=1 Tax=Corynebacterium propinquum TaxID=43769 RepID=UPI0003606A86|nr:preprotein translocase subunit YajC [Corynebacterium propinquum]MCT1817810.1 preprotein translocase subunit YajC [Corynebacterium propinquum]QQU90800.1 preprotein translocase subunit YajC [Corynebacterium propinquum]
MDIVLIIALLALFLLPSFFMMRKQRKQQEELRSFQQALNPGDRVITAGGIHLVLTDIGETTVTGEIAAGVEVTMEKIAILRPADQVSPSQNAAIHPEHAHDDAAESTGSDQNQDDAADAQGGGGLPQHPENDDRNN